MELLLGIVSIVVTVVGIVVGWPSFISWLKGLKGKNGPESVTAQPTPIPVADGGKGSLTVSIGIVQKQRSVLLVRRRKREGKLSWGFPTGIVKPNIDLPEEVVVKAVLEETGVTCKVEQQLGERLHPDTGVFCRYFHCSYLRGRATNKDEDENAEVAWVEASKVSDYITSDIFLPVKNLLEIISGQGKNGSVIVRHNKDKTVSVTDGKSGR